jgi:hypothetical protein
VPSRILADEPAAGQRPVDDQRLGLARPVAGAERASGDDRNPHRRQEITAHEPRVGIIGCDGIGGWPPRALSSWRPAQRLDAHADAGHRERLGIADRAHERLRLQPFDEAVGHRAQL